MVEQVAPAPLGHHHHQLRLSAERAVPGLPKLDVAHGEELRQVEVLEVVRVVDRRNPGQESHLIGEVDHVHIRLLDRPVRDHHVIGARRRQQGATDEGQPTREQVPHLVSAEGPGRWVAHIHDAARSPHIWPEPLVLAGGGQEEVFLRPVVEPGQGVGEADHDLFHPTQNPGLHPRVYAHSQVAHQPGFLAVASLCRDRHGDRRDTYRRLPGAGDQPPGALERAQAGRALAPP